MGGTDKWKMKYLLFVSLVYLVYLNIDSAIGSVLIEKTFHETSLNLSTAPNTRHILAGGGNSIVSCAVQCSRERLCIGYGYKNSVCIPIIQGVSEEPVQINLDGLTYYHLETNGKLDLTLHITFVSSQTSIN